MAVTFAAGYVAGGLIVLTVQSRPAPASVPGARTDARAAIAAPASARGGTHPAEVLRVIDEIGRASCRERVLVAV